MNPIEGLVPVHVYKYKIHSPDAANLHYTVDSSSTTLHSGLCLKMILHTETLIARLGAIIRMCCALTAIANSCKAGVLNIIKGQWRTIAIVNGCLILLIVGIYSLDYCALNSNNATRFKRLSGQGNSLAISCVNSQNMTLLAIPILVSLKCKIFINKVNVTFICISITLSTLQIKQHYTGYCRYVGNTSQISFCKMLDLANFFEKVTINFLHGF